MDEKIEYKCWGRKYGDRGEPKMCPKCGGPYYPAPDDWKGMCYDCWDKAGRPKPWDDQV